MTAPDPKHLRDQNKQFDTEDFDGDKSWQADDNEVSQANAATAQVPTSFPTGEDTELNTEDE